MTEQNWLDEFFKYKVQGKLGDEFFIAFAESSDGSVGFSRQWNSTKTYVGLYIGIAISDNYQDYTWVPIVGIVPQEKTVTPSVNTQVITPDDGYNSLSKVTVDSVTSAIDSNIVPENIKKDTSILGVTGTLEGVVLTYGEVAFTSNASRIVFSNIEKKPKYVSVMLGSHKAFYAYTITSTYNVHFVCYEYNEHYSTYKRSESYTRADEIQTTTSYASKLTYDEEAKTVTITCDNGNIRSGSNFIYTIMY